jgi:hypothetical protein
VIRRERGLWIVAALLLAAAFWRLGRLPDPYADGSKTVPVEDRRQHRFRDLGWSQTEQLFRSLVTSAEQAPDPVTRARFLARAAALQQERGLGDAAQAAAREALRFAPNDAETRRLLSAPLDLDAVRPRRPRD